MHKREISIPLEKRIVLLCHPIHARRLGHAIALDKGGVGKVGTTTQINQGPTTVEGHLLLCRDFSNNLLFEAVVLNTVLVIERGGRSEELTENIFNATSRGTARRSNCCFSLMISRAMSFN